MNQACWEQIGYTDSYDPWCISEFYFEGDYRQDGDGDDSPFSKQSTPFADHFFRFWLLQSLASKDAAFFDSIILKGMQVQALWFVMSIISVKAMSGVGDAVVTSSQRTISKISI